MNSIYEILKKNLPNDVKESPQKNFVISTEKSSDQKVTKTLTFSIGITPKKVKVNDSNDTKELSIDDLNETINKWLVNNCGFSLSEADLTRNTNLNPASFGRLIYQDYFLIIQMWGAQFFSLLTLLDDKIIETSTCRCCTWKKYGLDSLLNAIKNVSLTIKDDTPKEIIPYMTGFNSLFNAWNSIRPYESSDTSTLAEFFEEYLIEALNEAELNNSTKCKIDHNNTYDYSKFIFDEKYLPTTSLEKMDRMFKMRSSTLFYRMFAATLYHPRGDSWSKEYNIASIPVSMVNDIFGLVKDINQGQEDFNYILQMRKLFNLTEFEPMFEKVCVLYREFYENIENPILRKLTTAYNMWHYMSPRYNNKFYISEPGERLIECVIKF